MPREEAKGATAHVGVRPSEVVITRLKLDKGHKNVLGCKTKSHQVGKKRANTREKKLRRCRNKVIVYTTLIKNLK